MKFNKNIFLLNLLLFLTFDLMLLGAGVRTMDAGLTCPDWPLCFGKIIPKYHFGVYLEFIHRVIAGIVGLLYLFFFIQIWRSKPLKKVRVLSFVALFFLIAQIIMGGLTVLKLLEAYIVTMHLGLAALFLVTLFWIKKTLDWDQKKLVHIDKLKRSRIYQFLITLLIPMIFVQILLGGLVASTYSGLVCIDFPTCNGQYFPAMVGPIGLQMLHRFSAYFISVILITLFSMTILGSKKMGIPKSLKIKVSQLIFILGAQIFIGVMNLKFLMPPFLSVFHLALALTLLLKVVSLYFSVQVKKN